MKTNQWIARLFVGCLLIVMGCTKSNYNSNSTTTTGTVVPNNNGIPYIPGINPTTGGSTTYQPPGSGGDVVTLTPQDRATFENYVATHALNNPTNIKIRVNLASAGAGRYGGNVSISYLDNNIQYEGVFSAGKGMNYEHKDLRDNGKYEAEYNYWFTYNNTTVFSGFFEDGYGAIVIVLSPDNTSGTNLGDGQGTGNGKYAGHVYYKNFAASFAPKSPYRSCWFTYLGPYDCRSEVVSTKCGLYPGAEAGYKFLGSFKGLDMKKAFNM